MVKRIGISVFIGVVWMLLFSAFELPYFIVGFLVGLGMTIFYDIVAGKSAKKTGRSGAKETLRMLPYSVSLVFVFVWELIKANVAVLAAAFRPKLNIEPGIVALPIDLDSDFKIMMLANMITLTPGTISVEISGDKKIIFVHALDCSDSQGVIDGIDKAFTRRLKGVSWHDFSVR
jgi:multicomponent Na+:H+ antiporter subunit E